MFDKGDNTNHQKLVIELKGGRVSNESLFGEKISTYTDPSFCLTTIDQYTKQYKELLIKNIDYPISENNKNNNGDYKIGYWKLIFQLGTRQLDLNTAYTNLVSGLKENKLWKINVDLSYFINITPTEPQFDDDSLILTPTAQDFYGDKKSEHSISNGLIVHVYTPDYDNYNEIVKIYDFIKEKNLVSFCIFNLINYYGYNSTLEKTHILHTSLDIESNKRLQQSGLANQKKLCLAIWSPNTSSETLKVDVQRVYPLNFILREELFPTLKSNTELVGKSGANLLHLLMETEEEINSPSLINRTNFIEILLEPKSSSPVPLQNLRGKTLPVKPPKGFNEITKVQQDAQLHKKSMLNTCNDNGYTPAHLAVIHGKAKFLARIMSYPELDHKITNHGDTLLHLCARNNKNVLDVLLTLRKGNDKNLLFDLYKQNNDGYTPLHAAIVNKNFTFLNFFIAPSFRKQVDWYNTNLCKAGLQPNNQDNLVHLCFRQLTPPPNSASEMVDLYIHIEVFLKLLAQAAPHMFDTTTAHRSTPLQMFTRVEIPKNFDEDSKFKLQQISKTINYIISNAYNFYQTANNHISTDENYLQIIDENTALKKELAELKTKASELTQELTQLKTNSVTNKSPSRDPRKNSVSITPGKQQMEPLTRLQFFDSVKNAAPKSPKGDDEAQRPRKSSAPNSPRDNEKPIGRRPSAPNVSRRQLIRHNSEGNNTSNLNG